MAPVASIPRWCAWPKISGRMSKLTTPKSTPELKLRIRCNRSRNLSANSPPTEVETNVASESKTAVMRRWAHRNQGHAPSRLRPLNQVEINARRLVRREEDQLGARHDLLHRAQVEVGGGLLGRQAALCQQLGEALGGSARPLHSSRGTTIRFLHEPARLTARQAERT